MAETQIEDTERLTKLWAQQARNGAASDMVYQVLREALITGVVQPRQRLAEEHLARLFEVSRTPIREALFRLEAEGFAERIPRRGLVASQVTPQEIIDVYAVRESMDGLAAELAAVHASSADISTLVDLNNQFAAAVNATEMEQLVILNLRFHEALAQFSKNAFLFDMVKQIHHRVRRFPGTTFTQVGRGMHAVEEHRMIVDAIANHDPATARRLAAEHMATARRIRIDMLNSQLATPS